MTRFGSTQTWQEPPYCRVQERQLLVKIPGAGGGCTAALHQTLFATTAVPFSAPQLSSGSESISFGSLASRPPPSTTTPASGLPALYHSVGIEHYLSLTSQLSRLCCHTSGNLNEKGALKKWARSSVNFPKLAKTLWFPYINRPMALPQWW